MRRYILSGTLNTRDLGGYPAKGGRMLRYGAFIRSAEPRDVTEGDVEILKKAGVRSVMDLRGGEEAAARPSFFKDRSDFHYFNQTLTCPHTPPDTKEQMKRSYEQMIEGEGEMRRVVEFLADAEGAVLFHCRAGKDRTGVIAALLMLLAGVEREDICADYILTEAYYQKSLRAAIEDGRPIKPEIIRPQMEYIEYFLDYFADHCGTVEAYFERIGVPRHKVEKLRKKLLG